MIKGSVLVLDSNRDQAQRIATMLSNQNWTSVLSFDQRMASRQLKCGRFHLLLFDAYVEGLNKSDVIDSLRAQAHEAPLAIMSDNVHNGQLVKSALDAARLAHAEFVLQKPFTPEKLKNLLADTNSYHRKRMKEHHVLVIEDDPELRHMVCMVLKQVGYKVSYAANMEDAFFDHNLGMVDVVLTSVLIPGMGGIEGTAQIRHDWPHVQVICTSDDADEKITAVHVLGAARMAGAQATMAKPYTMPDMLKMVSSVIRARNEAEEAAAMIA